MGNTHSSIGSLRKTGRKSSTWKLQHKTRGTTQTICQLIVECRQGNYENVKNILENGEDVNARDTQGLTPLMVACTKGIFPIVELLLNERAEVNTQDKDGWSPLMIASQNGQNNIAKALIHRGAKVNMQNNYGTSPLMFASQNGHNTVIETLLESEADVNMQNTDGSTALITASGKGHANIVKTLIDKGAEVNVQTKNKATALSTAGFYGQTETVQVLIDNHADIDKNKSLLHSVIKRADNYSEIAQILKTATQHTSSDASQNTSSGNPRKTTSDDAANRRKCDWDQEPHNSQSQPLLQESSKRERSKDIKPASADQIAVTVGIDSKQLDEPACSEDLLIRISRLLPNWMEYADPLKLTPQETNGINTDAQLTYAMKAHTLLKTWYRKNAYTDWCHYRVLVETSCELGHADVAGKICEIMKASTEPPSLTTHDSSVEQISKDLILFKDEIIGGGAFGSVFRGELNGQPCAIKLLRALADEIQLSLPIASQAKKDSVDRFRQECERLESFKHPNVTQHLATRTHPKSGHLVLALELMDCNLRQFFSSPSGKDLPFLNQKSLCHDIASALGYIHSRHIVHRDLCSDNILLDCKGEAPVAKVCDFGMSTIITSKETSISLPAFGHRGYLPPEATNVDSSRFDSSFDIFQFGVIMLQIVQRLPTIKSKKERNSELDQIDVTHPLKSVIVQCLSENREDRPSALQLQRKLTQN